MTARQQPTCPESNRSVASEQGSLGGEYWRLLLAAQGMCGALGWALFVPSASAALMVAIWAWVAARGAGAFAGRGLSIVGTLTALAAAGWVWWTPDRLSARLPAWLMHGWISAGMALGVLLGMLLVEAVQHSGGKAPGP